MGMSIFSCDKADITFDTQYSATFNIDLQESTNGDGSASFTQTGQIDLNDGDARDYLDRLKGISITGVYIEVLSASAPLDATLSGLLSAESFQMTIPQYNILQLFSEAHKLDLTDDTGVLNYMQERLMSDKIVSYSLNVVVSEVPVTAEIKVTFKMKVTAMP